MLTLELGEESSTAPCKCCGEPAHMVFGLVYEDGHAHAVYLAKWSDGHPEDGVRLVVSLGRWEDGTTPDQRLAVSLQCRVKADEYALRVLERAKSPWQKFAYLGTMLDRDEALTHPDIELFLGVARHVVTADERLLTFLQRVEKGSSPRA